MASDLSRQIHSILIGEKQNGNWKKSTLKNTWDTYHLVPSSRPVVNPPEVRTMYVDVPGVDGPLDLTTALTGTVLYKNREGSWDFVVANDYEDWTAIYHKLMNDLHGKQWLVVLQDEPQFYYKGRLSVNEWKSERDWSKITLDYHFDPYKYEFNTSNEPWLWDPFCFPTGVIRNYGSNSSPLIVNGVDSLSFFIPPTQRICPLIIYVVSGNDITVKIGGGSTEYTLNKGENNMTTRLASTILNTSYGYIGIDGRSLKFSGHGSIWVKFQGGWL